MLKKVRNQTKEKLITVCNIVSLCRLGFVTVLIGQTRLPIRKKNVATDVGSLKIPGVD